MYYIYKYIENEEIVYIGQTIDLDRRIREHAYKDDSLFGFKGSIYYTVCTTKELMDLMEKILINKYHPKFNKASKYEQLNMYMDEPEWILYEKNNQNKIITNSGHTPRFDTNNTPEKDYNKEYFTLKELTKKLNTNKTNLHRVFNKKNICPDAIEGNKYLYLKEKIYLCFPTYFKEENEMKLKKCEDYFSENNNSNNKKNNFNYDEILKKINFIQKELIEIQNQILLFKEGE